MALQRRRQYLINKPLQIKFMAYLLMVVASVIVLTQIFAAAYGKLLTHGALAVPASGSIAVPEGSTVFWLTAITVILACVVLFLVLGLLYSHRIAGPLYNLKQVMARVQNGELTATMHIRSKDELHDVEAAFNQMTTGLNQRLLALQKAVLELPNKDSRRLTHLFREHFHLGEEPVLQPVQKMRV